MDPPALRSPASARRRRVSNTTTNTRLPATPRVQSKTVTQERSVLPSGYTVGQFSFAPATQTTVVTTTTTTTTTFPPLVVKPPRNLSQLDSKEYPLANVPTPATLKRLCFNVDGKPTYFREAEDAQASLRELDDLWQKLEQNNGVVRSEERGEEQFLAPETRTSRPTSQNSSARKRAASPVSILEAAERARSSNKRRAMARSRPSGLQKSASRSSSRRARRPSPPTGDDVQMITQPRPVRPVQHQQLTQLQNMLNEQQMLANPPLLSPAEYNTPENSQLHHQQETPNLSPRFQQERDVMEGLLQGTPSPQELEVLDKEMEAQGASDDGHVDSRASVETTAQPLSLPSPSLSPVTAALNAGENAHDYFEIDVEEDSQPPFQLSSEDSDSQVAMLSTPQGEREMAMDFPKDTSEGSSSLMSLPTMLDSFDAMPASVKSYMMYQFLRRCSKGTLQVVASAVNPALKCDFLGLLPLELSQDIMKYLDVKDLARCAQVSRKWRHLIDTSEWIWKMRFEVDGYIMEEGELDRAVREGWGFQSPNGAGEWERDLSAGLHPIISTKVSQIIAGTPPSRKRRVATRSLSKQQKKKRENVENLGKQEFEEVISEIITNTIGPSTARDAALATHNKISIGLPSLRNHHLFKSIYRRHHIIRLDWLNPEAKPRHISFRGHQRFVVTCLQFDHERILTGSDDTNINVYDTVTGKLNATLEGHEGGVWALQYEGNTLVSGSTDRTVRVWDIARAKCTQVFYGHTSTVRCLQILMPTKIGTRADGTDLIMPKQPLIITGSRDSTLRLWKLPKSGDKEFLPGTDGLDGDAFMNANNNPFFVRVLTGHQHSVRAISAHGDTLVSGSYDYTVRVWKISTGDTVYTLRGHTQKVYSVVLDHKRNRCISGSMDNLVKVWSLDTGTVIYTLEGHTQLVGLLDLSHDRLVSAAADSTLRIWEPGTGQCKHVLAANTGAITCFQHDADKVISGSDRTLKMWNVKSGKFIRDLLTDLSGVWQVKFNERRCVAAVQRDNVTYIEVLDFGAARDGIPADKLGRRIVVNTRGEEVPQIAVDATAGTQTRREPGAESAESGDE